MESVLGLIGMAIYMAAVVSLASAVTYIVVKLSPSKSVKEIEQQNAERAASSS
jgi:hypothetical protein